MISTSSCMDLKAAVNTHKASNPVIAVLCVVMATSAVAQPRMHEWLSREGNPVAAVNPVGGHLAARAVQNLTGSADVPPGDLILIYPAYLEESAASSQEPKVRPPANPKSRRVMVMATNDRPAWVIRTQQQQQANVRFEDD